MHHLPKVVVIGGGTGLPIILRGLRDHNVDITAIVTVADDGGSSGILRDYVNVVPPGDIRNALVALAEMPRIEKDIFQYRFRPIFGGARDRQFNHLGLGRNAGRDF